MATKVVDTSLPDQITKEKIPKGYQVGDKIPGLYNAPYRGFKMPGMSIASLKSKWSLIPLFVSVGAGVVGSGLYLTRLATRCPDVAWRQEEKQPWERLAPTHQYKFYSPTIDYSKLKHPADRPEI